MFLAMVLQRSVRKADDSKLLWKQCPKLSPNKLVVNLEIALNKGKQMDVVLVIYLIIV